jgi:hypothetical protein
MNKKVFRSRISILLIAFLLAIFIPVLVLMFRDGVNEGLYILGGALLFITLLFSGMRYVIDGDKLYCKIWGIPNGSIRILHIVSIKRSYNLLSSPAASLKRLCIRCKKGAKYPYCLISPVREQEFLEMLKAVNPDIDVHVPEKRSKWRIWDWDI